VHHHHRELAVLPFVRILAVIDSLGMGGAETQLAATATFLTEQRDNDCLVCSLLPRQAQEVHFGKGVRRIYLDKTSRLSLPRLIASLARVVREYRPDVAYSRLQLANGLTRLVTTLPGCRVRHAAGIDTLPEAFNAAFTWKYPGSIIFRWLERFADSVVCNSTATARAVIAAGYPPDRIQVIPNGIDLDRFCPPADRIPHQPFRLICVASLRPEKGVNRLVELLAPILQTGRFVLTLVGDGPERAKVERTITRFGIQHAVRLCGAQVDVVPLLQESDLYVSAAEVEGFGIAVAEAAATGLPVVCTAAPGGLAEVVLDGTTGCLVPEGRDEAFRQSVLRLSGESQLRARLGAAGREHVRQQFDIHFTSIQLERCLRTASS
jgi:glycosyltransferase involved in cell wall biosynthesis